MVTLLARSALACQCSQTGGVVLFASNTIENQSNHPAGKRHSCCFLTNSDWPLVLPRQQALLMCVRKLKPWAVGAVGAYGSIVTLKQHKELPITLIWMALVTSKQQSS